MLALAHLSLSSGTKTAKRNLKRGLASLKKEGINPTKSESVIDIGAGKKFSCGSVGQCPTLTASRCSSRNYWLTKVWALQLLSGKGTDLNLSFFCWNQIVTDSQPARSWGSPQDDGGGDGSPPRFQTRRGCLETGGNANHCERTSDWKLYERPRASGGHKGRVECSRVDVSSWNL